MKHFNLVADCSPINPKAIASAKDKKLSNLEIEKASLFFKIIGNPTRMKILWALQNTELCVNDLAVTLDMTKSAISHQLNNLKGIKVVKSRKEGKNIYYSLDDDHVTKIVRLAIAHAKH